MSNYKNLMNTLQRVCNNLSTTVVFEVQRNQALNIKEVKAAMVVVTNTTWSTFVEISQTGFVDTFNVTIRFIQKDLLDSKETQKNNIVGQMHSLQREFMFKLQQDDAVMSLGTVSSQPVYNALDANYTGVESSFNIEITNDTDYC